MKKKLISILAVVALLSIAVPGIGKAYAYFTSYAMASGGRVLALQDETTIHEKYDQFRKILSIDNSADSTYPVYVRAQGFYGEEYTLTTKESASGWIQGDDGYMYYTAELQPGETTTELVYKIADKATGKDPAAAEGKSFNIIVVYETIPAAEDSYTEAWNKQGKNAKTGGETK